MFEERIAAMNQRTEEAMAANAVQFDKRTYTVDEIQDILAMTGEIKPVGISVGNRVFREYVAVYESFEIVRIYSQNLQDTAGIIVPMPNDAQEQMVMADGVVPRPHCFIPSIADDEIQFL